MNEVHLGDIILRTAKKNCKEKPLYFSKMCNMPVANLGVDDPKKPLTVSI